MNGATAESAKTTNRDTMINTKTKGTSHHFLSLMMNNNTSFMNFILI